jgi:poly-beta-hydroxyalkanoate depolymerase
MRKTGLAPISFVQTVDTVFAKHALPKGEKKHAML